MGDACVSVWETKSRFLRDSRDKIFADFTLFYLNSPAKEDVRSPGGMLYWMRCIEIFNTFVSQDNKDPLISPMLMAVYARDLLLWVKKDYGVPTMSLNRYRRS